MNLTEIANSLNVKHRSGINNALKSFKEAGLVEVRLELPLTKWVNLTEKGKQVSIHVNEMIKAFNE
jgi:DNA-binding transcriptional regulator LsrR (DeoR family)